MIGKGLKRGFLRLILEMRRTSLPTQPLNYGAPSVVTLTTKRLYWLAGILEGEGSFALVKSTNGRGSNRTPQVALQMTDQDVVQQAAVLFQTKTQAYKRLQKHWKTMYATRVYGSVAAGWMMTLYPYMGCRRKAQINHCLAYWKLQPAYPGKVWGSLAAHATARTHNLQNPIYIP